MHRVLPCCTALMLLATIGRAGEPAPKAELLIRLDVEPAPAPRPALRYQLLPELEEMNPGNPIQGYLLCSMEHQAFLFDKRACDRREDLLAMPMRELPARDLMDYGRSALVEADRAARLEHPDWQILLKLREQGFNTLLPDVQQVRGLARALVVRLRAEIALGRFDDAIRTTKTIFAIARHMGEHPTIIGNLVGIAIANMALAPFEEMLQQPGCPDLYWALSHLPQPLVPVEKGMDGERLISRLFFRDLDERGPMSAGALQRFIAEMDKSFRDEEPLKSAGGLRKWLDARITDPANVDAARRRLVEAGLPEDRVSRFPPDQAILLDEKRDYESRRDDAMKTVTLPIWQAEALAARTGADRKSALFAESLTSFPSAARRARGRLEQRIALLRVVEALRLHAAERGGTLPAALSEVAVPLPDDPFTGKPFRYEVKGTTAHLRGSPPAGEEKMPYFNVHYEIAIRK